MEETVELTRPRHVPTRRTRSPLLIAAIACGSTVIGFGGALLVVRTALIPTTTSAPTTSPPVPAPPAHPESEDIEVDHATAAANPPRAAAPMLDARCMIGGDQPDLCSWDTGLPAISLDGTTIVHAIGGTIGDTTGTTIEVIDVKTSKVAKTFALVTADEAASVAGDDPTAATARIALAGTVTLRLAKLQDVLDAGHFRPLEYIGVEGSADARVDASADFTGTFDGDAIRLVRQVDDTVIFQGRVLAPIPAAPSKLCATVAFDGMRVWFDKGAQVVFTEQMFTTGADETCTDVEVARAAALR